MASSRGKRSGGKSVKKVGKTVSDTRSDSPTPPGTTGRYIVLMREGGADAGAKALQRVAGIKVARATDFEGKVRTQRLATNEAMMFETLSAVVVESEPGRMQALEARSGGTVVAVEPERIVRATEAPSLTAGNIDYYARGYRDGVNNALERIIADRVTDAHAFDVRVSAVDESQATWGLQVTNVLRSRFTGRGIRVAVLDTGFDVGHPDFVGRAVMTQSFVTGETVEDLVGHGTHCIGTACGPREPSALPRYGIASEAEIFAGKVLDNGGSGTDGSILAGMDWAVRKRCHIVSMSLGAPVDVRTPPSPLFERLARRALAAGTLIIAAAGNESVRPAHVSPVTHPANCPSILAVAAVDVNLQVASFSCGGLNPNGGQVDIAAPGVAVRSSFPRPAINHTDSGTSMAAPHVAGIAALLAEANPKVRGRALFDLLLRTARPLSLLPTRDVGAGLVQAP
jgi:subtilisin family serine protease